MNPSNLAELSLWLDKQSGHISPPPPWQRSSYLPSNAGWADAPFSGKLYGHPSFDPASTPIRRIAHWAPEPQDIEAQRFACNLEALIAFKEQGIFMKLSPNERFELIRKIRQVSIMEKNEVPVATLQQLSDDDLTTIWATKSSSLKHGIPAPAPKTSPQSVRPLKKEVEDGKPDALADALTGELSTVFAHILSTIANQQPALDEDAVRAVALQEVQDYYDGTIKGEVALSIATKVSEEFAKFSKPTITVVVQRANGVSHTTTNAHHLLPKVIEVLGMGMRPYLWGPPGTGKTHMLMQAAEALGQDFSYISLSEMSTPSALVGYVNPLDHTYHGTGFVQCWENGGLAILDEFDNANANVSTTLNGPLANGKLTLPDARTLDCHADFLLGATGNTNMRGGTVTHQQRRAQDGASIDRFTFIHVPIDLALEESLVSAYSPTFGLTLLHWWRAVREYVEKNNLKLDVTMRAAIDAAKLLEHTAWDVATICDASLFKGFNKDSVRNIISNHSLPVFTGRTCSAP